MVPLKDLLAVARDTFTEWRGLRWGDLYFDAAATTLLVLVTLMALSGLVLAARTIFSRKGGRTHVVLPAVLPVMRRTRLSIVRHGAFIVFMLGVPFFAVALADPRTSFMRQETSYPGRRIALMVDGSTSMIMKFDTSKLKTLENRTFYTAVAAAEYFMKLRMNSRYRDLMALLQFGNESYVVTPFTTDYDNIRLSIRLIGSPKEWTNFSDSGTTIMQSLESATQLFKSFDFENSAGNLMIVFSDGRDDATQNRGLTLADVVKEMRKYKIPAYMIRTGWGLKEGQINTDQLWKTTMVATGGRFYAADTEEAIFRAAQDIDRVSAGRIVVREYTSQRPRFAGYTLIAVLLWMSAGVMKLGFPTFRTFP